MNPLFLPQWAVVEAMASGARSTGAVAARSTVDAIAAALPLESARLRVRRVALSDLPALMAVNGDPLVTRFLPYATWEAEADARAWYERMSAMHAAGEAVQMAVAERDSDRAIGTCLLFRFEPQSARAELGYVLGRAHWGRGCMHEALTALIDAAFRAMALRRLEAEVDPRNAASGRLLARLGFTREGMLRQRWITKGVPTDVEAWGLLHAEWPGAQE